MFRKRWYWYSITMRYNSKNGQTIAEKTFVLGKKEKNQILDFRDTKKFSGPEFIASIPKHALCNGNIYLIVNAYLGRMPERKKK